MKNFAKTLVAAALFMAAAGAQATVVATDATYGAFDASSGVRNLKVTKHGLIDDLNLTITFAKCAGAALSPSGMNCKNGNPYNSEIFFSLMSPTGTVVQLVNAGTYVSSNSKGEGRIAMTFDDEAGPGVGGNKVKAGTYRPVGSLAAFDNKDMFGTWKLTVGDAVGADFLTYFGSSLDIATRVPEPGSLALFGLAALGLMGVRRRK